MAGYSYHTEDEILGKVYDHQMMKRLIKYAYPYRVSIILSFVLVLIETACFVASPRLMGLIIDKGVRPKDLNTLLIFCGIYLGIILLGWLLGIITIYVLTYLGQKIMYDMRADIFSHLQKMSLSFFDKNPVGRLVTRVTNDVNTLSEIFSAGFVRVFSDIIMIIGIAVVMCCLNTRLAIIALSVSLLLIPVTLFFRLKVRTAYREVRKRLARINAYIAESIAGIRITQLFNREEKNRDNFKSINYDYFKSANDITVYFAFFWPSLQTISAIAIGVVLYYGGGAVVQGVIELGVLVAFLNYIMTFFGPLEALANKYTMFQSAMASAERIFKILDTPAEITDPPQPVSLGDIKGEIKFENVWFAYPSDRESEGRTGEDAPDDSKYVLKNISFTIKPGESVAVVGMTGGGKSTIINLLARFYDVKKGRILIDGIDIKNVRQTELRKQMGVVLQDVFLFSGNILDNIRLGEESITLEKVEEVTRFVNAHTFIEKLPGKYYAPVMERGMTLSSGQRQLLSFARALVFNPRILILDEATSSVDVETECYIQEAISRLIHGKTSIIVAHRLSTIKNVNRIFVIHKGEIKEAGTHEELLAHKGLYYKLYQLQLANDLPDKCS